MKSFTLLSLVTAVLAAPGSRPLPPLVNATDVLTPYTDYPGGSSKRTDPSFCHYEIWEYSTWDCSGDDYTSGRNFQSTQCFDSEKNPNHCIWIKPLGDDRCSHDNTVWFYKAAYGAGDCAEHHKFEGKFDGETRMTLHHPWDSLILNK